MKNNLLAQHVKLNNDPFNPSPYNALYFDTYADCTNPVGKTATGSATLRYVINGQGQYASTGGTVKVSCAAGFVNGSSVVASQYVSIGFNSTSSSNGTPPSISSPGLVYMNGSTPVTVANFNSDISVNSFAQVFDVHVMGGNQLLLSTTGTYTGQVLFSFCDASGNVVSSTTMAISFNINFNGGGSGCTTSISSLVGSYNGFIAIQNPPAAGSFANQFSLQYSQSSITNQCPNWRLSVQATGNFINSSTGDIIDLSNVSINFDKVLQGTPTAAQMGISNTPVTLSTNETPVFTSQAAMNSYYTAHSFDVNIASGNYLFLIANGAYTTNLIFTVRDMNGLIVKQSAPMPVTINMQYTNTNPGIAITINGSSVSLNFATPANYLNGVSVTMANQLHITGGNNHYIVQASTLTNSLTSGTNTIPTSVVKLSNIVSDPTMTAITSSPIFLSSTLQTIIDNPSTSHFSPNYADAQFNLTYSINGGNTTVYTAPAGTYTTQVIFTVLPQ